MKPLSPAKPQHHMLRHNHLLTALLRKGAQRAPDRYVGYYRSHATAVVLQVAAKQAFSQRAAVNKRRDHSYVCPQDLWLAKHMGWHQISLGTPLFAIFPEQLSQLFVSFALPADSLCLVGLPTTGAVGGCNYKLNTSAGAQALHHLRQRLLAIRPKTRFGHVVK